MDPYVAVEFRMVEEASDRCRVAVWQHKQVILRKIQLRVNKSNLDLVNNTFRTNVLP